jgi:DNA-binding NarL/FixJ family response regulator/type II secretory pathway predicted ATPase ExeA
VGPDVALFGRSEELRFVAAARRDGRRGVVLAGEAGVGKSRLAREALAAAEVDGWSCEVVVATASSAGVPLAPFAALVAHRGGEAAALDFIHEGLSTLLAATADRRLVLMVDDAHLLDEASAALLHLIISQAAGPFVVATVRSDEQVPDAVARLWRDSIAERVDLQPLSRAETDALVHDMLEGDVDAGALRHVWQATAGNPLFVREYVLGARETGTLVQEHASWRWRTGALAATPRLRDLVEGRIRALDAAGRALLEVLALGGGLELPMIDRLGFGPAAEAAEALGLVAANPSRRRLSVALAHPLYGEVLARSVPPLRARAIHRKLVEALEAHGPRRRVDLVRLASWRLQAGDTSDRDALIGAARHAYFGFFEDLAGQLLRRGAAPHAETAGARPVPPSADADTEIDVATNLARAALDRGADATGAAELARALIWQNRLDEADAILAELERSPELRDDAEVASARAAYWFWGHGDFDAAVARLTAKPNDALDCFRAGLTIQVGNPRGALPIVLPLIEGAVRPIDRARAAGTAAGAQVLLGQCGAGLELVDQHLATTLTLAADDALAVTDLVVAQFYGLRLTGRLDEAAQLAQFGHDAASTEGSTDGLSLFAGALGMIALDRGRVATAAAYLRDMVAMLAERDGLQNRCWGYAMLATAYALMGEVDAASAAMRHSDGLRRGTRFYDSDIELARAWILAASGDQRGAIAVASSAAARAEAVGMLPAATTLLHAIVRFGGPVPVEHLEAVARQIDSPVTTTLAQHAAAVSRGDAGTLETVASEFESNGMLLLAAEAWAAAGALHDDAGRSAPRIAAQLHMHRLTTECEGASTPALHAAPAVTQLTPREQEVARLAAQGMSNVTIAEKLVLSVRTVESHLYRAFVKLGVEHRRDIEAALDAAHGGRLSTAGSQMQ